MTTLRIKRGDTLEADVAATLRGQPEDITGASLWFTAKRYRDDLDSAAVLKGSTSDGKVNITDPTAGIAEVVIPASDTAGLEAPSALYWDVQISSGGIVKTLDDGILYIDPDVTRATA